MSDSREHQPAIGWYSVLISQHKWFASKWYAQHGLELDETSNQAWSADTRLLTSNGKETKTVTPPPWFNKEKRTRLYG